MISTISELTAALKINRTGGKIFGVTFVKKDNTVRNMQCRLHVKKGVKGVGLSYDPAEKGLIGVYDMAVPADKNGFRMVNIKTLSSVRIEGKEYNVMHNDTNDWPAVRMTK